MAKKAKEGQVIVVNNQRSGCGQMVIGALVLGCLLVGGCFFLGAGVLLMS